MPGSAAATRDRTAALSGPAWLGSLTSPVTDNAVPGAVTRSCRMASGRAWPANTASPAATAAVTRVVSAAAASTTQCAIIRRVAIGPRGFITWTAFRIKIGRSTPSGYSCSRIELTGGAGDFFRRSAGAEQLAQRFAQCGAGGQEAA
jgi:hypothetical protein